MIESIKIDKKTTFKTLIKSESRFIPTTTML